MIVKIPKDIYSYENKVVGNFTSRQLICLGIALLIIIPVFAGIFIKTNSVDLAATVSFIIALPVLLCSVFKKDGQHLEKIIYYKILEKFKYRQKRKFVMSNLYEEIQRNQKEYEFANEKLKHDEEQKKEQNNKKRFASLVKKETPLKIAYLLKPCMMMVFAIWVMILTALLTLLKILITAIQKSRKELIPLKGTVNS